MSKYDVFGHANKADFEQGREDGSRTNPYHLPGSRAGDALEAYSEGYKCGSDCMDDYVNELYA